MPNSIEPAAAWLGLSALPGVGRKTFRRLVDRFGSPEAVLNAKREELDMIGGIPAKVIDGIVGASWRDAATAELQRARAAKAEVITSASRSYPENLAAVADAPLVLYVRGRLLPRDRRAVAIVGTRTPTLYGVTLARRIARDLALAGITIVSGLARGIDTNAHRGALEAGGRTIAVLGSGIDVAYPPENRDLMEKIAITGAVLSENPVGPQPEAGYFPARNRIISGLSLGTIIIEAAEDSGSLITADYALQQQRALFAVPGNIGSPVSKGTNNLIRQGAVLVESASDIVRALALGPGRSVTGRPEPHAALVSSEEEAILARISGEPRHIDQLLRESGVAAGPLAALLTSLELKGIVRQMPGKYYIKESE